MKDAAIVVGVIIGLFLLVFAIGFLAQGTDFVLYKFFAPKYAAVQRDVYEQTPSYVRGNVQNLQSMRLEYNKMKSEGKEKEAAALKSVILQQADGLNQKDFPPDLLSFINSLRE